MKALGMSFLHVLTLFGNLMTTNHVISNASEKSLKRYNIQKIRGVFADIDFHRAENTFMPAIDR